MSSPIDATLSGNPVNNDSETHRRAQEERQAVLRMWACRGDAEAGARAVAARAGYSPATMTAYVAEMAGGHGPGRVLDAAASEPGAVVWHALEVAVASPGPIEAALRRPAAELEALAPADLALVVEQAAFAQVVGALAGWQRGRRALYAAGGGEDAFRYVLDDDQLLALWACVDLAQLREALPALRVVDQRAELLAPALTDALAGLQIPTTASDMSMGGVSQDAESYAVPDVPWPEVPQERPRSATSDVPMTGVNRETTSNPIEPNTSTAEFKSGAESDTASGESISMTELLFGVQVGQASWDMSMSDSFSGPDFSDHLPTSGPPLTPTQMCKRQTLSMNYQRPIRG